jgi:uncharacterized protein
MVAIGVFVGLPVIAYGIHWNSEAGWDVRSSMFLGTQFNYWAAPLVSLAWISLVMLACKTPALSSLTRPFAAVGRMAFTNYLLQTVICTTIFYGHGLGLFGRVERVGQISIVAAVLAFQLIVSPIWLSYFRYGPAEWLWRSLTYWRPQPMRR